MSHSLAGDKLYRIAYLDHSTFDNFCSNAAMSAHGIVSTGAKIFLHFGTRMTIAGHLQYGFTNLKPAIFECQKVDARYNYVAAGKGWEIE